jgi:hypothetical protein
VSSFVAEPVPQSVESELAEYLNRMMVSLQIGIERSDKVAIVTTVTGIPDKLYEGGFVNVYAASGSPMNGLWGCMYSDSGVLEWRQYKPA